jgi:predicted GTPase
MRGYLTVNVFQPKHQVLQRYQDLLDDANDLFTEQHKTDLSVAKARLEKEQFSIVVAGRFSSGKSLLINRCFLRSDVLPSTNKPTTCHPVQIVYGETNQLTLCNRKGDTETIPDSGPDISEALTRYGAQYGGDPDRFEHLILQWNDPEILKNGLVIVDTIGTEDIDDRYIHKTHLEMSKSSAVLFVFNAQQAGAETEWDFLERHLAESGKRLFVVINKSDSLNTDADRAMVLDDLRERLTTFFAKRGIRVDERVFMVSAKTGDGLDDLRRRLVNFIARERIDELVRQHVQELQRFLESRRKHLQNDLQNLEDKKNSEDQKLREAQQKVVNLEADLENRANDILNLEDDLVTEATYQFEQHLNQLKEYRRQIRGSKRDVLPDIINEIVDKLTTHSGRVGQQLQREIRKAVDKKISSWGHQVELDRFEMDFEATGGWDIAYQGGKVTGVTAMLGGAGAAVYGVTQGVTASTAVVTAPITTTTVTPGLLSGIKAALMGSTVTTTTAATTTTSAWTAAVAVGGPIVLSGIGVAALGYAVYKYMDHKDLEHEREKAQEVLDRMLQKARTSVEKALRDYAQQELENALEQYKHQVQREKERLAAIIAEQDELALQRQIDKARNRLDSLKNYQTQL